MQQIIPVVGVANKPHPSHLKNEYLQYAEDVDFQRYTIAPMRTDRKFSEDTGKTIYLDKCCFKISLQCVNVATDPNGCERVFASNYENIEYPVTATPEKFCLNQVTRLGWPCVLTAPSVAYASTVQSDRVAEPRSYVYTFTNIYGEESQPSWPSPSVVVDFSVEATIASFAVPGPEYATTQINIYMLVAGLAHATGSGSAGNDEYLRVATLPITALMFTHQPLVHPFGQALLTDEFTPVPDDATEINWFGAAQIVFKSQGNVRFTEPYNYSAAPLKYTYATRSDLLRILACNEYIYLLTCSHPEALSTKQACDMSGNREAAISGDKYPLIGMQSPAIWEKSVIFASTTGLVQLTGPNASVITSDSIFTRDQWDSLQPHTMRGITYDGYYYGATDTCTFRLELANGGKSGSAEKFSYLSIRPTAWYVTHDNRLMYADADGTWEFGQGDDFKVYKAVTRDICELGQSVHSTMRITSEPGDVSITQTVSNDLGVSRTHTRAITKGGMYKLPRSLGSCVSYTFSGTAEITGVVVGNSVHNTIGKA